MRFPEITISGTPEERGVAHGAALSAEIEATIDYYAAIFKKPSAEILDRAKHFRDVIRDYSPAYCKEIEGIATGAKIKEPLWIYALNARSEILAFDPAAKLNECTALCFLSTALLGQNWDWGQPLEDLVVLMQVKISEDHTIQMLTEPGIIGKIGLNSFGIGCCLNILLIDKPLDGVPIHIVLRAVLESRDLEEVKMAIRKAGYGKASNILFGDSKGNFNFVEFAGDQSFMLHSTGGCLIHTNHYLGQPINPNEGDFRNSYTRYRVANKLTSTMKGFTIEDMKTVLSDHSDPEFPIWRAYVPDEDLQEVGTVASIIMDLKKQKLYIRRGNYVKSEITSETTTDNTVKQKNVNDFVVAFEN
jgi:isopenicillin-N N-acyltransferase-like protein